MSTGAYSNYGNDSSTSDTYGRHYNWYAGTDSKALCPAGWAVPAKSDFVELTDYLGGNLVAGGKMKLIEAWPGGTVGNNDSGFSAIPAGLRNLWGLFVTNTNASGWVYFWTSSEQIFADGTKLGLPLQLLDTNLAADISNASPTFGFSVRCVSAEPNCNE